MTPPNIAYSTALMVAGLICLVAGVFVLQTRRISSGSIPLGILMFALSWWDFTYSLFWAGAPAPYANFWLYITYVGAVIVPAALMLFAIQISGMGHWLKVPFLIALSIEPLLILFSLFTDPWHGLFFDGNQTQNIGMILAAGPVFWANVIYSYLFVLIACILLIHRFTQTSGIYKQQIGLVLIGITFPWLNSFIFVFGLSPFPNADNTPLSFSIAGLAFTYALLHYRLLDIAPIARHVLIENMSDGVMVIDARKRLMDINPAAEKVLGLPRKARIGEPVENLFPSWLDVVKSFHGVNDTQAVVPIGDPPHTYFDLKVSPLYDDEHRFLGQLVVWRDITPLKKAQAELREQAIRDALTGLYNRRYLNESLERELARAHREESPVSLVMIDIDHFKDVNDTFGHNTGDAILQRFATQLMNQTRVGDIVCRYGGEEFLVVLPKVTAQSTYRIAERWRKSFQETQLSQHIKEIKATISCGISEFPVHGSMQEELISIADKALYHAKQLGRNRVVIWQSELDTKVNRKSTKSQ
ncbi:MAG TPA: diguanylate cyclase [Anaerolineales bacterium]|nr:diguanylate cyclase [Anaerolineales bacterium]